MVRLCQAGRVGGKKTKRESDAVISLGLRDLESEREKGRVWGWERKKKRGGWRRSRKGDEGGRGGGERGEGGREGEEEGTKKGEGNTIDLRKRKTLAGTRSSLWKRKLWERRTVVACYTITILLFKKQGAHESFWATMSGGGGSSNGPIIGKKKGGFTSPQRKYRGGRANMRNQETLQGLSGGRFNRVCGFPEIVAESTMDVGGVGLIGGT